MGRDVPLAKPKPLQRWCAAQAPLKKRQELLSK